MKASPEQKRKAVDERAQEIVVSELARAKEGGVLGAQDVANVFATSFALTIVTLNSIDEDLARVTALRCFDRFAAVMQANNLSFE